LTNSPDPRSALDALAAQAGATTPVHHGGAGARLRRYFLTGLVIAGPLAVTAAVTWWFINLIDGWVKPFIPKIYLPETYFEFAIPGFGLVVAMVGLTLLGFLTANLIGRTLVETGEGLLERTPVIKGLYKALKQMFETVFAQGGTSFKTTGLVEFPVKGTWSIVFISQAAAPAIGDAIPGEDEKLGVFLPCTPNPTTGFFFYLPRKDVVILDISVEDAFKIVMSAGVIQPETLPRKATPMAA
jgi:uncharacterized membrane protein